MNDIYVQYGCGWSAPKGWLNYDSSPTLRFERIPILGRMYTKNSERFPNNVVYGDILKSLPLMDQDVRGLYCSHVLEHLTLNDLRVALRESYRVLSVKGTFRMVVPDLEYFIDNYNESTSTMAAINFLRGTGLGVENKGSGLIDFIKSMYGNSQHLWMWDYKSLKEELKKTGFVEIRRAQYGDSSDVRFNEVESKERWDNCLGIECKKK